MAERGIDVDRLAMAQGLEPADMVLKHARVVNVFTSEILEADIAMADGVILGVGEYQGHNEVDMQGQYVCPGFIDAHLHLESSMVTPAEVVNHAVQWGTTTFIVDPHEAANVVGPAGIEYVLAQTALVSANVYVMLPSCVPSTSFEDNGFTFTSEHMRAYVHNPRILGLGEMMDYRAVLSGDHETRQKIDLFRHKIVDGHAPGLSEKQLSAYVLAGVGSDHETVDFASALRARRQGMQVLIREGSAARNLEAIVRGIVETNTDTVGFSFCTDDKHVEDIQTEGHISFNVKKAIACGLDPVKAVQMATINTARFYGLRHLGAIAPGYQADLVVLRDLTALDVQSVYHKGVRVDSAQNFVVDPSPPHLQQTVRVADGYGPRLSRTGVDESVLQSMIALDPGQITTRHVKLSLSSARTNPPAGLKPNKAAVIERHRATGRMGIAYVLGFGLTGGALASTVAHDSHNLIVIGDNDGDMILAVKEIVRIQGGFVLVSQGQVLHRLPLPIMGLLSDAGFSTVHTTLRAMKDTIRLMGVPADIDPFVNLSFISLPVIPELRLTTRGLFDVSRGLHIDQLS